MCDKLNASNEQNRSQIIVTLLTTVCISRIISSSSMFRLQQLNDYIYSYILYYTTLKIDEHNSQL